MNLKRNANGRKSAEGMRVFPDTLDILQKLRTYTNYLSIIMSMRRQILPSLFQSSVERWIRPMTR